MSIFSERFCKRRKELNFTQQEIAEKLNVGYRTVSHWENGAYPDGELLPKIAEVLDVSLDYLFGRKEPSSYIEQEVLNHFQKELNTDREAFTKELLSKVIDLIWAVQISWQKGNKTYWKDESVDYKKASVFLLENGFSFLQHKTGSRFYCLCEKPENGFGSLFKNAENISKLLKFLSETDNQKILLSLFSLKGSEYISIPVLANQSGINKDKIQNALNFLETLRDENDCSIIYKINYNNNAGSKEYLYKILLDKAFLLIMIFVLADELQKPTPFFDNSVFLTDSIFY